MAFIVYQNVIDTLMHRTTLQMEHHEVCWLVGSKATKNPTVLASIACLEYKTKNDARREHPSIPHYAHEGEQLRVLLPVGIDVLGMWFSCDLQDDQFLVQHAELPSDLIATTSAVHGLQWSEQVKVAQHTEQFDRAQRPLLASWIVPNAFSGLPGHRTLPRASATIAASFSNCDTPWQLRFLNTASTTARVVPLKCGQPLDDAPRLSKLSVAVYAAPQDQLSEILPLARDSFDFQKNLVGLGEEVLHFQPSGFPFIVSAIRKNSNTWRANLASRLSTPVSRPQFKTSQDVRRKLGSHRLFDVHLSVLRSHGLSPTARLSTIWGSYEYCHYLQDGERDDGWGCAYRSLQTVCSWLRAQGYSDTAVPSIDDIQTQLVAVGDKEPSFVGSSQWIGAIECSMLLDHLFGLQSRIISVRSGGDLHNKAEEIAMHFEREGAPIIVGGGVLAYTLLGVAITEQGQVKWLILDPHYKGPDELKAIVKGKWIAWRPSSIWRKDAFYNLCCPMLSSL